MAQSSGQLGDPVDKAGSQGCACDGGSSFDEQGDNALLPEVFDRRSKVDAVWTGRGDLLHIPEAGLN